MDSCPEPESGMNRLVRETKGIIQVIGRTPLHFQMLCELVLL
ncbi:hypothetical protein [Alkalihalobacillus sp. BA299]|nr:hypothetical protein [Alkalihalobacillus sp. BA299]